MLKGRRKKWKDAEGKESLVGEMRDTECRRRKEDAEWKESLAGEKLGMLSGDIWGG